MKHVTSLQLCAFVDDVLVGAPDDGTARHLATCAICRTRYESWCHVDDSLRELLGQDPDEHAMEQRMSWVEIAVAAERKGLPAPEFAELRIPAPPPTPSSPPVQVFPPGRAPVPGARFTSPPAPPQQGPAFDPARTGAAPREPIRRPVLQSPILQPAAPVAPRAAQVDAGMTRSPSREPVAAQAPPAKVAEARGPGYARMPRTPRKGFMAFVSRPAVWVTLALVAAIAGAVPLGVARFGIPEIKFGFHPAHEREADVKKASADATTDREDDAEPARPKKSGKQASATPADPDASVLFDLPALEPEDGEPDQSTEPETRHSASSKGHAAAALGGSTICGEVRNPQDQPIEGARVYLVSPSRMVRTDKSGRFCVACPPGKHTIRIEAPGRATVTRTVQLGHDRLETRFTLNALN